MRNTKTTLITKAIPVELLVGKPLWYLRDASFWDRPDTRKIKKVHLMDKNGCAKCNLTILLNETTAWEDPPETLKCKRCLKVLPTYLQITRKRH